MLGEQAEEPIVLEIGKLNLTRYISEIAQNLIETKVAKASDVPKFVAVCSAMHQRYAEFSDLLLAGLLSDFGLEKKSKKSAAKLSDLTTMEKAAVLKRKATLRLLVELYLAGLYDDASPLLSIIELVTAACVAELAKPPKTDADPVHALLGLALSFLKYGGGELLQLTSRKHVEALAQLDNIEHTRVTQVAAFLEKLYAPPDAHLDPTSSPTTSVTSATSPSAFVAKGEALVIVATPTPVPLSAKDSKEVKDTSISALPASVEPFAGSEVKSGRASVYGVVAALVGAYAGHANVPFAPHYAVVSPLSLALRQSCVEKLTELCRLLHAQTIKLCLSVHRKETKNKHTEIMKGSVPEKKTLEVAALKAALEALLPACEALSDCLQLQPLELPDLKVEDADDEVAAVLLSVAQAPTEPLFDDDALPFYTISPDLRGHLPASALSELAQLSVAQESEKELKEKEAALAGTDPVVAHPTPNAGEKNAPKGDPTATANTVGGAGSFAGAGPGNSATDLLAREEDFEAYNSYAGYDDEEGDYARDEAPKESRLTPMDALLADLGHVSSGEQVRILFPNYN